MTTLSYSFMRKLALHKIANLTRYAVFSGVVESNRTSQLAIEANAEHSRGGRPTRVNNVIPNQQSSKAKSSRGENI